MQNIEIFTDGACRGNPGPGGWGALLCYQAHEKMLYGFEPYTTNNRMELMAAIMALKALKQPCHVNLSTDSQYLKKGITEWLSRWQKQGWRTSTKAPVKNTDLWQELAKVAAIHNVTWHWVRGHDGHQKNERADQLANQAIDENLAK